MKLSRWKITVLILALAVSGAGGFWLAQRHYPIVPGLVLKRGADRPEAQTQAMHHADDKNVSLAHLTIYAFYFVPAEAGERQPADWQQKFGDALSQTAKFYRFQLHGANTIDYRIYPKPVSGFKDSSFYDGRDTGRGNQRALLSVRQELIGRAMTAGGDLYDQDFAAITDGSFPIMAILYEGVGSSATLGLADSDAWGNDLAPLKDSGMPALLVSRNYLSMEAFQDNGITIFAHELGHTLGLSDGYDLSTGQPSGDDLMGIGRFRPLSLTYLSLDNKKLLGLTY